MRICRNSESSSDCSWLCRGLRCWLYRGAPFVAAREAADAPLAGDAYLSARNASFGGALEALHAAEMDELAAAGSFKLPSLLGPWPASLHARGASRRALSPRPRAPSG